MWLGEVTRLYREKVGEILSQTRTVIAGRSFDAFGRELEDRVYVFIIGISSKLTWFEDALPVLASRLRDHFWLVGYEMLPRAPIKGRRLARRNYSQLGQRLPARGPVLQAS